MIFKKMAQHCAHLQTLSVPTRNRSAVGGEMSNTKTAAACSPVHDIKQN